MCDNSKYDILLVLTRSDAMIAHPSPDDSVNLSAIENCHEAIDGNIQGIRNI